MVPTLCRIDTDPLLNGFLDSENAPCCGGRCRGPLRGRCLMHATDPRNAGKALLYALNKIPDAESACAMKGQNVSQIQEMFQLMEHFPIHQLHNYQLSQEITSWLLRYLGIVTLCIVYLEPMHIRTRSLTINHASELRKQRSFADECESSRRTGRAIDVLARACHRHDPAPPAGGAATGRLVTYCKITCTFS
jgi:hypothetical protein